MTAEAKSVSVEAKITPDQNRDEIWKNATSYLCSKGDRLIIELDSSHPGSMTHDSIVYYNHMGNELRLVDGQFEINKHPKPTDQDYLSPEHQAMVIMGRFYDHIANKFVGKVFEVGEEKVIDAEFIKQVNRLMN